MDFLLSPSKTPRAILALPEALNSSAAESWCNTRTLTLWDSYCSAKGTLKQNRWIINPCTNCASLQESLGIQSTHNFL